MATRHRIVRAVAALALALAARGSARAAEGMETATVPLRIVQVDGGLLKVGIELRLGGGEPRLYEFDTGAGGFYAAYNPLWWPSFEPLPGPRIEQTYGSHVTYEAERVRTVVGIPTDLGEIEAELDVAKITDAWGGPFGPREESPWLDEVEVGIPPLWENFFGDFGSDLREKNGLFAVLPQLPGNLSSGFAVQLGCGGRSEPTLVIGLTDAVRSRVKSWVPMRSGEDPPSFPHSGRPTYEQKLIAADFSLLRGAAAYAFSSDAILDTGGPTPHVHEHGDEIRIPDTLVDESAHPIQIRSGARFRAAAAGTDADDEFDLDLLTGRVPGFNRIDVSHGDDDAYVNLGLIPFLRHDVVFDVERGLVGFAPCRASGPRYDPVRKPGIPTFTP